MTFRKQIGGAAALGVAMLVGFGLSAPPALAAFIETLVQQGSNVVATGSGTIDLAGLSFLGGAATTTETNPKFAEIFTGPAGGHPVDDYTGFTGPASFGSGGLTFASSGSGDIVGIAGVDNDLVVPQGYVSGSALSDSSTYDNKTFSSLGVTPGSYVWTWGSGATADSFTLTIGAVAVPAPVIGQGLPVVLAVGGVLFGAKFSRKRRALGPQAA